MGDGDQRSYNNMRPIGQYCPRAPMQVQQFVGRFQNERCGVRKSSGGGGERKVGLEGRCDRRKREEENVKVLERVQAEKGKAWH